MRTTIRIRDELLREVKSLAARRGTTLTAVIEEALRDLLSRTVHPKRRKHVELPVSKHGGGTYPGIDISDTAALQELFDQQALREGGIEKLR